MSAMVDVFNAMFVCLLQVKNKKEKEILLVQYSF